jgi:hypothetical protein
VIKIEAKKDGKGNIVISEDSFEMVLACLDNQKFIGEQPQNGDSISEGEDDYWKIQEDNQKAIDYYNRECRKILHQKYIFSTDESGYFLIKKYEYQEEITPWTSKDVELIYELFKDTRITYKETRELLPLDGSKESNQIDTTKDEWIEVEPESRPWLIERPLSYDYDYLTISEDGKYNRLWKQDEIEKITNLFNNK